MPHLQAHEVHVWSARLDISPAVCACFYATLSDSERERAARLCFKRDQQRFVAAHGVLRALLGCYLDTPPARLGYVYNTAGKPGLGPAFAERLNFNLSHSGDLALIALAANVNVGVDVEAIHTHAEYADIAQLFFSRAEVEQLSRLPDAHYAAAFLRCWTRKEAYLKARGDGFTIPLELLAADSGAPPPWSLYELQPAPGYIAALAIADSACCVSQYQWEPDGEGR